MKKIVLPRRALFLWQLRAVLVTFLAAFLLTLLLSDFLFWYRLSLILIGLAFLFFLDSAGHRQIYNCRGLRHCVEGLCELALLVRGSILVDDTVRSSLIDLLYGKQICALRGFLVAGLNGSIILLDNGAKLIVCHLVAKRFSLNDFYALFR
mgnify:CR=1 FL=1